MKKIITILLLTAILISLAGCTASEEKFECPVNFYYPRVECTFGKADSVLAAEVREAADHKEDLKYLIEQYLQGPQSQTLYSPIPAGTKLVRLEQNGTTLNIILDSTFAELTGLKLTLACAALSKTCLELAQVDTIQISADGPTLDGERSIVMDAEILELLDRSAETSQSTTP